MFVFGRPRGERRDCAGATGIRLKERARESERERERARERESERE